MALIVASGVIPAFGLFAEDLNVSIQKASYLTSVQILVLGISPLIWRPLSSKYGRRPVWLISTALSAVFNVGCALSPNFAVMIVMRVLAAFFVSPASAIGSGVVTEIFFARERGNKIGIWTLMVTLGIPLGPFVMGFVAQHAGWQWIYWIYTIVNGVQFVAFFFFGAETRYLRRATDENTNYSFVREYLTFKRIDAEPFSFREFYQPILLAKYASILIPTICYSHSFNFTSVYITVEIPQIFGEKFQLNPQQIGLQYIAMIIGSVLGEQLGGPMSDYTMNRRNKALGHPPSQEYRLWSSYFGFCAVIAGLVVFGVQLQLAPEGHWNVTPAIGVGISAFGNQVITTVLVTYAVDCHREHAASIGVFVNLIRSTWGFIGVFWFSQMSATLGLGGSAGLQAGLVLVVSVLPIVFIQWAGARWRRHGEQQME
ncbi:hypothetical protein N7474_001321 [Penicillium riverlandense]|uniref:uncharacterized protein n=1 Tax=Penicillium riverlandense TaxID=1903569 RepID=UPI0025470EAA|nr:uncharacterized protein N7474_001321 [Penicillium riverlandense]KAJ5833010.1 hypothetical protein N7474_001321 [Penicillium riverlandense]